MKFLCRNSYLFLLLFMTLSCKLEKEALDDKVNSITDINKAKNWYEENEADLLNICCTEPAMQTNFENASKTPDWDKALVHHQGNGIKVVEVKLNYDTYLFASNKENPEFPTRPNVLNSLLLLEIDPGIYRIYTLKIFPEESNTPLQEDDFDRINFGNVTGGFSGSMMIFDWKENFIGGWEIQNGIKEKAIVRVPEHKKITGAVYKNESMKESPYYVKTDFYSLQCSDGTCQDPVLIRSGITYIRKMP